MNKKLRIAQVAPLFESVPPKLYGGTERVVSYLTEGLVNLGHDVTLFASGDSVTRATLDGWGQRAIRLDPEVKEPVAAHAAMLGRVMSQLDRFDLVHFHCDFLHLPLLRFIDIPFVTTLHGRLDQKEVKKLYQSFSDTPLVSISLAQRKPLPFNNWVGNVYHGLPREMYRPGQGKGDYLAFLGRVSPEKGLERAIDIARRAGMPIRIAAKIDPHDATYFRDRIEPLLAYPGVEYIGEIGEKEKEEFLGNAKALLFPIDWPEPFGMVVIEAMACGTPVLGFDKGSIPELIVNGINGAWVGNVNEALRALPAVLELDRKLVRQSFEKHFSQEHMTLGYLEVYRSLTGPRFSSEMGNLRELEVFL